MNNFIKEVNVHALLPSCLTLCVSMDYRPPGSSVHGILRQEQWSGLPGPPSGDLPVPGIEPASLTSLALAGRFFTASATWETPKKIILLLHFMRPLLP